MPARAQEDHRAAEGRLARLQQALSACVESAERERDIARSRERELLDALAARAPRPPDTRTCIACGTGNTAEMASLSTDPPPLSHHPAAAAPQAERKANASLREYLTQQRAEARAVSALAARAGAAAAHTMEAAAAEVVRLGAEQESVAAVVAAEVKRARTDVRWMATRMKQEDVRAGGSCFVRRPHPTPLNVPAGVVCLISL